MTAEKDLAEFFAAASEPIAGPEQPAIGESPRCPVPPGAEAEGQGSDGSLPLPSEPCAVQQRLSRRQFLQGGLAGGAAGLVVAVGTGAAAWQVAEAKGEVALEAANAEIERLQRLVGLYEQLESANLDEIIRGAMAALALPLQAVETGVKGLKGGLDLVQAAALSFREALPTAQEAVLWVEERISSLAEGISKVEAALGQALDRVTSNPLADRLKEFANLILDNLPFGLGAKIRNVLESLADLVTGIDALLRGVNAHLLEPLRVRWFAQEEGEGIGSALIDPLVSQVLDPLEAHLGTLGELLDSWQNKLAAPAQTALDDRAAVRAEIVRYKQEHGL